jgi:outer membrane protein OmpA-like peptidoglycan-associated protein
MKATLLTLLLFCATFSFGQGLTLYGKEIVMDKSYRTPIHFEVGKALFIKDSSTNAMIDSLTNFMKRYPTVIMQIEVNVGPKDQGVHEISISKAMAQSVIDEMIQLGADSARLVPKGWDISHSLISQKAISAMKTQKEKEAAYTINRRTEFRILSNCYKHPDFNWTDNVFYEGSKRRIQIEYTLDNPTILEVSLPILDTVIRFLKKNQTLKVEIDSHTDPQGSVLHNNALSAARAQCCVDYLRSKGIDSARVTPKAYGMSNPLIPASEIAKMKTKEERDNAYRRDRRTEVLILSTNYKPEAIKKN